MERISVTLSLPISVIEEARRLAAGQHLSLEAYLELLLEAGLDPDRAYREARERQLRQMEEGLNLGTNGEAGWSREDLYER